MPHPVLMMLLKSANQYMGTLQQTFHTKYITDFQWDHLKKRVLIVSIFSACVLTILATFFAVLNQKAIGDGALYSLQSATIFTDMAARCGWAKHTAPKLGNGNGN